MKGGVQMKKSDRTKSEPFPIPNGAREKWEGVLTPSQNGDEMTEIQVQLQIRASVSSLLTVDEYNKQLAAIKTLGKRIVCIARWVFSLFDAFPFIIKDLAYALCECVRLCEFHAFFPSSIKFGRLVAPLDHYLLPNHHQRSAARQNCTHRHAHKRDTDTCTHTFPSVHIR